MPFSFLLPLLGAVAESICKRAPPASNGGLGPIIPFSSVTVSGQSAGASAALQHAIAFSASTHGVGIAAGSPYGCGVQPLKGLTCYYGGLNATDMLRYIGRRHQQNLIDDPANLRDTPVLLFNGNSDYVVLTRVMRLFVEKQLSAFDVRAPKTVFNTSASHVWSIDHGNCTCGACWLQNATGTDSTECCAVNNCGYDLSGDMLRTFFGEDAVHPRVKTRQRGLRWIEQWRYLPAIAGPPNVSTLLRWAPVYVPKACEERIASCAVQ